MLIRPVYAGYLDVLDWQISLLRGKHQPIVDFEIWQKVQDRLLGKAKAPIRKDINADFPYAGS